MKRELLRALTAEAIGTFALVFAGCGAIMVDTKTQQLGHVGVAITFGLVIRFGIYAAAAALLRGSLGDIAHVGATLPAGSQGQAFLWEMVMSAFLMFVILAVATDTRRGRSGGDRHRRNDRARRHVRRPDHRRLDEPHALIWPGARLRRPARTLGLHPRANHRRLARRPRLPVRARRADPPRAGL
jgi:hypothetical protein